MGGRTVKLAYLIPEGQYTFFRELVTPLGSAGIDVVVNEVPRDTDVILVGILPVDHHWIRTLQSTRRPFILWHWDLYSFTDTRELRWQKFLDLLPRAADIWSCTYEVARQLKEVKGLDSTVIPAWVNEVEIKKAVPGDVHEPYALYAASGCGFGKRIEWAERACQLLDIPLTVLRNQRLSRQEYLRMLAGCRVYLMTAFEESNGTIPAMEAAAMGNPVVLANLPTSREVFGDTVRYFDSANFGSLTEVLQSAWDSGRPLTGCQNRILKLYGLSSVAARTAKRIKEVCGG
jgi:glycosyltransferase involved in cell wall biosynthesis